MRSSCHQDKWLAFKLVILMVTFFICSCEKGDNQSQANLTPAEKQWLALHQEELYFAPDPLYAPFEFYDEKDGLTKGLAHDYVALVEKKIGVRFKRIRATSFAQILVLAKQRQIAIVNAATKTPERSQYLLFTEPYIEIKNVILVRKSEQKELTLGELRGKTVSVVQDYAVTEYLAKNYPDIQYITVPADLNALLNVTYRISDAAILDLATASYFTEKEGLTELRVAGDIGFPIRLAIGSRKDWPELNNILRKGLAAITPQERKAINEEWISLSSGSHHHRGLLKAAASVIALLLMVLGAIFIWNKQLKRQVLHKTSELENALEDLKRREEEFRSLFDDHAAVKLVLDPDTGAIFMANKSAEAFYGWPRETLEQMRIQQINTLPPDEIQKALDEAGIKNRNHFVFKHRLADGSLKDVEIFSSKVTLHGHVYLHSVIHDITERKRAQEALLESESKLRALFETIPVGISILNADGKTVFINPALEKIMGMDSKSLLRGDFRNLLYFHADGSPLPFEEFASVRAIKENSAVTNGEVGFVKHDGSKAWVNVSAVPFSYSDWKIVEVTVDITEQKHAEQERQELQARLQRVEKMEALGTLAGGVAHDLNNLLGVFVGYADLLLDEMPEDSPYRAHVERILEGGNRAAEVVQELLTLARRGVTNVTVLNLNRLITTFLETPEYEKFRSGSSRIKIETELAEGLLNIKGAPSHITKTFMNLLNNAVEAMPGGGRISIKTENRILKRPVHGYDEIKEGEYVVLSVTDTGEGIAQADLSHIFEPFYTKKVMGRSGTGLGLAVVWGTVKDLGGYIDVQSTEGKGTKFNLYFPATLEPMENQQIAVPVSEYTGNNEAILVVDDIKEQREMAARMLTKLNYRVNMAASGEEAIDYLKTHKADLIVLDMIMDPGMDGLDTYKNIQAMRPGQKALIVSGYSATKNVIEAQSLGAGAYINKPYTIEKLGRAVKKELG